jgi:formamidopyrimidine-DNA glycosylase
MKMDNFFIGRVVKFHRDNLLTQLHKKAQDKVKRKAVLEAERRAKFLMSQF